jgi:recombination protein RecR
MNSSAAVALVRASKLVTLIFLPNRGWGNNAQPHFLYPRSMSRYAEPMSRLIDELKKLPGVGTKTAQRYAFHVLRSSEEDAAALADAVRGLKMSLHLCSVCNNVTDVDPCAYCTSPVRNQRLICVVEEPTSIASVERTRGYQGVYHVLHGTLSPLHGVGPDQLRSANLLARVERGEVDEVILATSPTLEGEATASWLATALRGHGVKITRIATGVPAGSDIEYADEVSMARAMEGRREL